MICDFNPRSREGSDVTPEEFGAKGDDFNPRSREGSDKINPLIFNGRVVISIHAPAKGATPCFHVPAQSYQFQSTLPRRERQDGTLSNTKITGISIHAPAKGATYIATKATNNPANFNPRSREGSDIYSAILGQEPYHFNPRSREGSDSNLI